MKLFIFLKNCFLTFKGHPKGQILAIMVHFKVFGHRVKNIQNIPKIYAYIIKVEDLLVSKMVFYFKLSQLVFKWLKDKNTNFYKFWHFHVKFTPEKLLAPPLSL